MIVVDVRVTIFHIPLEAYFENFSVLLVSKTIRPTAAFFCENNFRKFTLINRKVTVASIGFLETSVCVRNVVKVATDVRQEQAQIDFFL